MTEETTRKNRKEITGFVRSKTGEKSLKVVYEYKIPHSLQKEIRRKTTVHVHDENGECNVGDEDKDYVNPPDQ